MTYRLIRPSLFCVSLVNAVALLLPTVSHANLLVSRGDGRNISSLSVQLLDEPRSAAGRRKNVWDADPPEPAINGLHYFLYDFGPDGKLLPQGQRPITVTGAAPGPSYDVIFDVLVQKASENNGQPFFMKIPESFDYDGSQATANLPAMGYQELGIARVQFSPYSESGYGQIEGELDSPELAYDGYKQGGQFVRGDEHVRIFTQTLAGHDDDTLSGSMTTLVPAGYIPDYPTMSFDPGYLQFVTGTSTGSDVMSATVSIPEPTMIGIAAAAVCLGMSRRRYRTV